MEKTEDRELGFLLKLSFSQIRENRYVFPNPMDEPILWGKFMDMVDEALEEARIAADEISKAQASVAPKIPGLDLT